MLSVVMLTGLLQQKNSNFEGVTRRKFAAVSVDSPSVRFLASYCKQIDGETYIAEETEDM